MSMSDAEIRACLDTRLAVVREQIARSCARVGRDAAEVTLVAVTKSVNDRVARLIAEMGVLDLAENRPQSLWHKAELLKDLPVRWYLIGHLQRNKVERTLPLVHCIHSIDSERVLDAVAAEGRKTGRVVPVLLQVNASIETQKGGFSFEAIPSLAPHLCSGGVEVVGLMGMAAYGDDPEKTRPTFRALRELRERLRVKWASLGLTLPHLSMGMSNDYPIAIEEGATMIRLGTTLFEGLPSE